MVVRLQVAGYRLQVGGCRAPVIRPNCANGWRARQARSKGCKKRHRGNDGGGKPDEENGGGAGEAKSNEAMREVIGVAMIKGFSEAPAENHNVNEIEQRDSENDQR